jgi:hypothetical protein
MFETSPTTEKLDAALAKAQGQIKAAIKDAANPFFKSKYADLPAVWAACQGPLTDNGISVSQWPVHSEDGRMHIVTRLACAGEWMRCEFSIPVAKQDAQGFGSAVTYARRFALAAAVGVVADEDDDGNAASGKSGDSNARKPPARSQNVPTTAPAVPPSGVAPSSGSSPETDEQCIERWTKVLKGCKSLEEVKATGMRISKERGHSNAVQLALSVAYADCCEAFGAPRPKKKEKGPCSNCGETDHSVINCKHLSAEERAEALRASAAGAA